MMERDPFNYHPPQSDEERAMYAAITDAAVEVRRLAASVCAAERQYDDLGALFAEVNETCRALAQVIERYAPPSADRTAAIRCVRLARNAINEMVAKAPSLLLRDVAVAEAFKAQWQANAAIALS